MDDIIASLATSARHLPSSFASDPAARTHDVTVPATWPTAARWIISCTCAAKFPSSVTFETDSPRDSSMALRATVVWQVLTLAVLPFADAMHDIMASPTRFSAPPSIIMNICAIMSRSKSSSP
ncbi:MAG: hypothetical protein VB934_05410, partial [Polyangiaceae bacterium]